MSQMTVSQMSIRNTTPSPQQRQHWLSEHALAWSGLPIVTIWATVFLEGFFLLHRSERPRPRRHTIASETVEDRRRKKVWMKFVAVSNGNSCAIGNRGRREKAVLNSPGLFFAPINGIMYVYPHSPRDGLTLLVGPFWNSG